MQFSGEFETHVTVRASGLADVQTLRSIALKNGWKLLVIELATGQTPVQPMITYRGWGTLTQQIARADEACCELRDQQVVRVKIEASIHNQDIPQADAEAESCAQGRYFEHHIKVRLDRELDLLRLASIAQRHQAHLSRNAVAQTCDGMQDRFVTQRAQGVGCRTAGMRFGLLVKELGEQGFAIIDSEEEYVVQDTHIELDRGWLM